MSWAEISKRRAENEARRQADASGVPGWRVYQLFQGAVPRAARLQEIATVWARAKSLDYVETRAVLQLASFDRLRAILKKSATDIEADVDQMIASIEGLTSGDQMSALAAIEASIENRRKKIRCIGSVVRMLAVMMPGLLATVAGLVHLLTFVLPAQVIPSGGVAVLGLLYLWCWHAIGRRKAAAVAE